MTLFNCMESWMGRLLFANFHVRYVSPWGNKSHYVPPSILLEWFKTGKVRFPLEGATVYIDEAYMYMECAKDDTLVETRNSFTQVKNLHIGDEVKSIFGFQPIIDIRARQVNTLYDVRTKSRSILCTANHVLPVRAGGDRIWPTPVKQLYDSMYNYPAANFHYSHHLFIEKDPIHPLHLNPEAILFGIIAAEGSIYNTSKKRIVYIALNSKEIELQRFIINQLQTTYPNIKIKARQYSKYGIALYFCGKSIITDFERRFNAFMASMPSAIDAASFLKGFVEGDGTVGNRAVIFSQSKKPRKFKNLIFAKKCLNILDIKYKTYPLSKLLNGKMHYGEEVAISSKTELRKYNILCGFISDIKSDKLHKALFNQLHKFKRFVNHEKILSIKEVHGQFNTYDITVKSKACPYFYANGILSHNSRAPNKQSTEFTYMILQSRKMGANVLFAVQLTSCLDPNTKIEYSNGSTGIINNVTVGDRIIDNGVRGKTIRDVTSVRRSIAHSMIDVALQSGHSLSCTPEHTFPVYKSWSEDYPTTLSINDTCADELRVGDYLKIDGWPTSQWTLDQLACLYGLITADGSWKIDYPFTTSLYTTKDGYEVKRRYKGYANQLIFTINKNEVEVRRFIISTLKSIIPEIHIGIHHQLNGDGLTLTISKAEHVHMIYDLYQSFMNRTKHNSIEASSWVKGMFEGDACPAHTVGNRSYSTVTLTQGECNRDKLEATKKLLWQLDIPFNEFNQVRQKCMRCGGSHIGNHLTITALNAGLFASKVGFLSQSKHNKLVGSIKSNYSRIECITKHSSNHPVIDISLGGNQRSPYFMANGIRTHNSIDKRLKFLANYWILCNRVCLDGVHNDYHFEFMDNEGNTLNELYIREEPMKQTIYGLYDTQEIVTAAGEAEEAMTEEELGEAYTAIAPFFLRNRQRYAEWMKSHIVPLVPQPQTIISQMSPASQPTPTAARLQIAPSVMQIKRILRPIVRQVA